MINQIISIIGNQRNFNESIKDSLGEASLADMIDMEGTWEFREYLVSQDPSQASYDLYGGVYLHEEEFGLEDGADVPPIYNKDAYVEMTVTPRLVDFWHNFGGATSEHDEEGKLLTDIRPYGRDTTIVLALDLTWEIHHGEWEDETLVVDHDAEPFKGSCRLIVRARDDRELTDSHLWHIIGGNGWAGDSKSKFNKDMRGGHPPANANMGNKGKLSKFVTWGYARNLCFEQVVENRRGDRFHGNGCWFTRSTLGAYLKAPRTWHKPVQGNMPKTKYDALCETFHKWRSKGKEYIRSFYDGEEMVEVEDQDLGKLFTALRNDGKYTETIGTREGPREVERHIDEEEMQRIQYLLPRWALAKLDKIAFGSSEPFMRLEDAIQTYRTLGRNDNDNRQTEAKQQKG